jgi:hypothetical protein
MIITFWLHALRVRADILVRRVRQAEQLEQRADFSREERRWQFAEPSDEFEVLDCRLKGVEVWLFRDIAEAPAEGDRIVRDVPSIEEHGACRCLEEAGEHPRGRALSGSVRTKVTDHLTSTNLEADVADDCRPEESLYKVSCF